MTDREKVNNGLEKCAAIHQSFACEDCEYPGNDCAIDDAIVLLKALSAFKAYFDDLYGKGLEVANWHMNGATEPFDNFYDSAMEEYENARCD